MNGGGRNHLIDITKGICILFVIFTHYQWTDEQWHKMLFPFWIDMAVPMFMIISGYVSALSLERKNYTSIVEAYSFYALFSKCIRLIVPFTMAFIIEVVLEMLILKRASIVQLGINYFRGGYGPGSYYFPVMIQFVFLYPCIYFILKRYNSFGLILVFLINAAYEFFQRIYGMNGDFYRLLILRYIFIIAFGTYVYLIKDKSIRRIWGIISLVVGIAFIGLVEYTSYIPKIIIYWTRTSFIACLYIVPFAYMLLRVRKNVYVKFLEVFGRASFNIFLTQMVYFNYMAYIVYQYISFIWLRILLNILICVLFGILFYCVELQITKKILVQFSKKEIELNINKLNQLLLKSDEYEK